MVLFSKLYSILSDKVLSLVKGVKHCERVPLLYLNFASFCSIHVRKKAKNVGKTSENSLPNIGRSSSWCCFSFDIFDMHEFTCFCLDGTNIQLRQLCHLVPNFVRFLLWLRNLKEAPSVPTLPTWIF